MNINNSTKSYGQNEFERKLSLHLKSLSNSFAKPNKNILYPNNASQGIMVPSGWGGNGTYLFGFVGGAYPEVYTKNKLDMIAAMGLSFGDPEKFLNFATSINMGSLRRVTDFSANVSVSKSLSGGTSSITAGGIQLFAGSASDAPEPTFFIAFSHAFQGFPSKTPGCSKVSYTIGIGNGRYLSKSGADFDAGKGSYGTAVFAGVSYEIIPRLNVNAEWYGQNLGISFGVTPFKNSLSLNIGLADLTRFSSNRPNMIFSIGYPLSLNKNKL